MKNCHFQFGLVLGFLFFLLTGRLAGQKQSYRGPDDPAGDPAAVRTGVMDGNRILLRFRNTTQLSDWPQPGHLWPGRTEGDVQTSGMVPMILARVTVTEDTIPVTDPALRQSLAQDGRLDTLYYCQVHSREEMDRDPTGTIAWGFYPVSGYFNPAGATPAMSNDPSSWPPPGWPASDSELKWYGEWNGRFGRGIQNADLETYFTANDAQDQEHLAPEERVKYYPRPGVRIGNDISGQAGAPWGGIGIRVEQRGYQWNNPELRDVLLWEFAVANVSDYDLNDVVFGFWLDIDIGGITGQSSSTFDIKSGLYYEWNQSGTGLGGISTGTLGFAFPETPGISCDGVDNDEDGLVDEKRDNLATRLVGPTDGIADLRKFLEYYDKKNENLKLHWNADEDQDWQDGVDPDSDGQYADQNENGDWVPEDGAFAGDDVGLDGVGPAVLNYNGPDEGECNHKPDFRQGVGCEPNFATMDVHESDQIGISSASGFPTPTHVEPYSRWFRNDRSMWELVNMDTIVSAPFCGCGFTVLATGLFLIPRGAEERISLAELHAYDALEGLNSPNHSAPSLFELKREVQRIYHNDYRFSRTPDAVEEKPDGGVPNGFELLPLYPNPFNSATVISFFLPSRERVLLSITNLLGQKIVDLADGLYEPGRHEVHLIAAGLPAGLILVQIRAGEFHGIRKCLHIP